MKLVLIDRDGVLNREIEGYVKSIDELEILPQALEALALFKENGLTCVVITNQSVVGRGIISQSILDGIHAHLIEQIKKHDGDIAEVVACTDHPERATDRRKPRAGMILEALQKYDAAPEDTAFIGDSITDMQAAFTAGCARYMVMTGKGATESSKTPLSLQPIIFCEDILDAAKRIIAIP